MAKKATVDTYVWEGMNKQGKRSKGEIAGSTIALVKADLRRQGVTPLKVKKKPKSLFGASKKKITPQDISIFSRQLATMMSAGVPLVQAFEIVAKGHENPSMQDLIMEVKTTVEGGSTLAEALAKHPYYFDDLYCSLVHAGEQAGILETLLDKIATYKEKVEGIKGKIKKALFYPAAIIVVSFIITAILLIFVIPQFEAMFTSFGGDLPAMTKFVVELSKFFQAYWWAIFSILGGAIYGIGQLKRRSKKFNIMMDHAILKMPIIGDIITKAIIARFARTLATMFAAGMPLVEAMDTVANAAGNAVYTKAILSMKDEVATGQQINVCMKETGLFPNMVVQMLAIGEETGSVDTMLAKVADFYEEEVDNMVDGLSSLLEPVIMAVLGVLIGGLVIAMYLPIFKMGQVV
ncbi:MAG: type II secretion system F family protein [Ectothiorhodospiraceae bacterium]|nr:type II secretion system F family protein [Ectothiorhodospiraceae bacterium]